MAKGVAQSYVRIRDERSYERFESFLSFLKAFSLRASPSSHVAQSLLLLRIQGSCFHHKSDGSHMTCVYGVSKKYPYDLNCVEIIRFDDRTRSILDFSAPDTGMTFE